MSSSSSSRQSWRDCVDWLTQWGMIRDDHKITERDAEIKDLAAMLRDGVLLCMLLNKLMPGAIAESNYSRHPQTSLFLYKKNVKIFLETCQKKFGLQPKDLFSPFDMMECSDFSPVINTLSKLSQTRAALASKIPPFKFTTEVKSSSSDYVNVYADVYGTGEDDSVYCNATDLMAQHQEESIYGRLMDFVQAPVVEEAKKPTTKKDMCVKELIDTEKSFVDVLTIISEKFKQPLKTVLTLTDLDVIFGNIETLFEVHSAFFRDLSDGYSNGKTSTIADCFVTNKEKFLVYGDYCANLPKATKKTEELCKSSSQIKQAIEKCEASLNHRFTLDAILVVPMQRVLKYNLFLKELCKFHPEEQIWTRALSEIQDLSLFINEVKRDNEMCDNLEMIEKSISGLPLKSGQKLKDYGRLIRDGELKYKAKKTKARHIFLLDKLIIICALKGDSDKYENNIEISKVKVLSDVTYDKSIGCHTFTLKHVRRESSEETFVFGSKTKEEASSWIKAIELAMDNVSPQFCKAGGHDFVMYSFKRPTICDVCRKLLRGTFYQGYTCKETSKSVHKECIEQARFAEKPTIHPRRQDSSTVTRASSFSVTPRRGSEVQSPSIGSPVSSSGYPPFPRKSSLWSDDEEKVKNNVAGYQPPPSNRCQRSASLSTSRQFSDYVNTSRDSSADDYVNLSQCELWFADNMSRVEAEHILASKSHATFLIRPSARSGDLALSINVHGVVRHIIINRTPEGQYYFKINHIFSTLEDLVSFYQQNFLAELSSFLGMPYKQAGVVSASDTPGFCTALYNYAATAANQLSLRQGDRIEIISKESENCGWWKGKLGSKIGYFPYMYVEESH